jgi:hypothetical protein
MDCLPVSAITPCILVLFFPSEEFHMPVEPFKLGKERGFGEVTVQDADTVKFINGGDQVISCLFDGFEVTGGNVAGNTDDGEIFHFQDVNVKNTKVG